MNIHLYDGKIKYYVQWLDAVATAEDKSVPLQSAPPAEGPGFLLAQLHVLPLFQAEKHLEREEHALPLSLSDNTLQRFGHRILDVAS